MTECVVGEYLDPGVFLPMYTHTGILHVWNAVFNMDPPVLCAVCSPLGGVQTYLGSLSLVHL